MSTDLREDRTLESRPRLKATCIKLQQMAMDLGPEAKLPTIAELREGLGVSVYTLNDAVRELERRQVLRSVNGVGIFVASPSKVLLGTIGITGSSSFENPQKDYYNKILKGMQSQAQKHGQHFLFLGPESTLDINACSKVDGLLIIGADIANDVVNKLPKSLPMVAALNASKEISSVVADDYEGARLGVRFLHENNHRRIACLIESDPSLSQLRYQGYCDQMVELGIEVDCRWIRKTEPHGQSDYLDWGRQEMQRWLKEGIMDAGCSAIFVQNETAAIGVMQVLQEEGIQVPQQVSVIGFDGTRLCDFASPRLCAVEVPLEEIGIKAMQLLNQQIHGIDFNIKSVKMPLRIRQGESVAPRLQ